MGFTWVIIHIQRVDVEKICMKRPETQLMKEEIIMSSQ